MKRIAILLCLLSMLALAVRGATAYAQEETPPVGESPGEGVPETGHVYFYLQDRLAPVPRDIAAGGQRVEFAVMELLNGPKEEEKAAGYVTYIPEGVKLQYTTVKQDRTEFSVNLSREFLELSGDREAALRALAQLVKTIREASQIQKIGVTVASEDMGATPEDAFAALGVSPKAVDEEIAGVKSGGGRLGLILALALGIPLAAAMIFFALLWVVRRRKSMPGRSETLSVGTGMRTKVRVKRRKNPAPVTPAPWKEGGKKKRRKRSGKRERGRED